ncbi:MAG TPA: phosphatidate cytidylyltransferase, partial [Actinomycetota bacterium]|nr:phosphatidate cytidylyltransferase [Actinomycetota bacterium]
MGAALALGAAAALLAPGGEARRLFAMWRTWATIAPLYALAVTASPWTAAALAAGAAAQGLRELSDLGGISRAGRRPLVVAGAVLAAAPALAGTPAAPLWAAPLAFAVLAAGPVLAGDPARAGRDLPWSAVGLCLVALPLASLPAIRAGSPGGAGLLLAIGAGVALSDVTAFFLGRAVRGGPLAPRVSPAKTRAGLAGNLLGAAAGFA